MPDNNVGGAFEIQVLPTKNVSDIQVKSQTSDPYRTGDVMVIAQGNQPKTNNLKTLIGSLFGNSLSFQAQAIDTAPATQKDNSVIYLILAMLLIFGFAFYFSKKK